MSKMKNIPVSEMRNAAAAWRRFDKRNALNDRVDDLIDEIERLRIKDKRDYFAGHAPEPPSWFEPCNPFWNEIPYDFHKEAEWRGSDDYRKAVITEWPWAYADAMLAARDKD